MIDEDANGSGAEHSLAVETSEEPSSASSLDKEVDGAATQITMSSIPNTNFVIKERYMYSVHIYTYVRTCMYVPVVIQRNGLAKLKQYFWISHTSQD